MRLLDSGRLRARALCSLAAVAATMLLTTNQCHAQDLLTGVRWNTAGAGNWSQAGNWTIAGSDPAEDGVPGEGEVASVQNGGTAEVGSSVGDVDALSVSRGSVAIGTGGSLTVLRETVTGGRGNVNISGNGSLTTGSLANVGGLSINGPNASLSVGGDFNNLGTLTLGTSGADPYAISTVGGNANFAGGKIDLASTPTGATFAFGNSWGFMNVGGAVSGQPSAITVGGLAPNLDRGLALQVGTDGDGNAAITVGSVPVLSVDRATGAMSVTNVVGGPVNLQGYLVQSKGGNVSRRWNSLEDQDVAGWTEARSDEFQIAEYNLSGATPLAVGQTVDMGIGYVGIGKAPKDEDLNFSYLLEDGRVFDGIVEYLGPASDLVLSIDPESGGATIQNLSTVTDPYDITGYTIASASGSLLAEGLTGLGADAWTNANPTSTALTEVNLNTSMVFGQGVAAGIGNIFNTGGPRDLTFQYSTVNGFLREGTVEYGVGGPLPPACAPLNSLLGDLNGDGSVAFPDFLLLSANFGNSVSSYSDGDINCDGTVSFPDFLVLSSNFGQSLGATSAVPEPSAGLLALIGLLGMMKFRKRAPHVLGLLVVLGLMTATSDQAMAVDLNTRLIRLHPEGPNNTIGSATEARGILNGKIVDIIKNEDVTGTIDIVDFAGGAGSFNGDSPYPNGVNDESMSNFLVEVKGVLEIPAGEWTIGFGSDDGGFLNMPGIRFTNTFNESGEIPATRDGEIFFNPGRGHAWTAGTFRSSGVVTEFTAMMFEGGGGDSFEIAVIDGFIDEIATAEGFDNAIDVLPQLGFELEDGVFDWKVLDQDPPEVVLGDITGDGVVDDDDESVLNRNLGRGTTLDTGDINGDGVVDLFDVSIFASVYTPEPEGAATSAVPEPGSLSLILLGAAALLGARRRRVR